MSMWRLRMLRGVSGVLPGNRAHAGGRRSFRSDERGVVAIEFAAVSTLFLMILFGIIAFGFQFATRIALSYAVSEGGRAAVAGLNDEQRVLYAKEAIQNVLNAYAGLVDVDQTNGVTVEPDGTAANGDKKFLISIQPTARFAYLPFVPDMSNLPAVSATFIVADPSG
ncbi:TadE/TadG family type IV pilus assembly protein [Parvibaculum sp.]|uniref:TadE/TadG family type IV pilus assembly protein n=1 Tax=Parvibaculum sp. TaxID=2024848 RepID=UPI002D7F870E|nr:TadE/TadG family type IV pilus assembly protein [Parvibaculum sp.]